MLRAALPRLGRIRTPRPPPEEPSWPPEAEEESVPFRQLPEAVTRAATFSSSSPLSETPSAVNSQSETDADDVDADGYSDLPVKRATRWEVLAKRRAGSQFLDYMHLTIRGGRGGDGCVAFSNLPHRRDSRGPPSGGAGGEGGPIYIQACDDLLSLNTLVRQVKGKTGGNGMGDCRQGKKGEATIIKVPPGTMIRQISRTVHRVLTPEEEALPPSERDPIVTDRLLIVHPQARQNNYSDIPPPPITPAHKYGTTIHGTPKPPPPPIDLDLSVGMDEPVLLCRGGRGGEGNVSFGLHDKDRQSLFARRGEVPDEIKLELELRLLADVGLLGAPNAGKSTLLQALTSSKPQIASYQFTTLNPNIGLCRILGDGSVASAPAAPQALETPERNVSFEKPVVPVAKVPLTESLPVRAEGSRSLHGRRGRVAKYDEALRFKICDNPGLVRDSHLNRGLGHQFLLSISRSPILVLVLDFSLPTAKLLAQADMLLSEVRLFEPETRLHERIRLVVANKADLVRDEAQGRRRASALRKWTWKNLGTRSHTDEETGETYEVGDKTEVKVKLLSGK